MKAFGNMGQTAQLCIIQDRFIAGHDTCELRRHLDSVSRRLPSGILLIVAWCGSVMPILTLGGLVRQYPTGHC